MGLIAPYDLSGQQERTSQSVYGMDKRGKSVRFRGSPLVGPNVVFDSFSQVDRRCDYETKRQVDTRIAVRTVNRLERSERIRLRKGLPQGDALCQRLLSINPLAWTLRATAGNRLSRPISQKVTDRLYIDDLKINASSQGKLKVVTTDARIAMKDIGLE